MTSFAVGSLVSARGREWVVLPDSVDDFVIARPLGGSEDDVAGLIPAVEPVTSASFPPPTREDLGDESGAKLLRSAVKIGFRSTAGPFRSLASIAVEPRAYQLVPLLMALRQSVVRLLIADDVGIGKTIEAGLIAKELLELGEARGLTVLCSPALAEQWQNELLEKFGLEAELVLPSTIRRLERQRIGSESIFERFPITVVSTDFIKSDRRRHEFIRTCPDLVIVDEAHTCVAAGGHMGKSRTQRYDLIRALADDEKRHLLLVTATPHSGHEATFRNLIGLLDDSLHEVDLDSAKGRTTLAQHFVQRRRADIRHFLDENTPFPRDRESKELPYSLSNEYRALFDDVLNYARSTVQGAVGLEQRINWWSALALLRSLASSPKAAARTLATRSATLESDSKEQADAIGRSIVLDLPDDESVEAADATPGAEGTKQLGQLTSFKKRAEALTGDNDPKLKAATKAVKDLLKDGYNPIVFCRFIDTAEYLGEHLGKALGRRVQVAAVTGTLPPAERITRIEEFDNEQPRVLVATDCLSEGVNLQDKFQAVVHYDLAWNPTRHEQREGRVDRFGQLRDVVRTVTIYGQDNHIDGIVLDVLIRKHAEIRKATGVSVPVPNNSDAVLEALMEGLILRGADYSQDTLDIDYAEKATALDTEWRSAAEQERQSRTKFAQQGIHPEEVAREVSHLREKMGSRAEVRQFVREALASLHSTVTDIEEGFTATTFDLPLNLRAALPNKQQLVFKEDFPVAHGESVLHRTNDDVEAVAQYVVESALDPTIPHTERPATRCAVIRSNQVAKATVLLLARYRFHLTLPSRSGERTAVAEEVAALGYTGLADPQWLSPDEVESLFDVRATSNIAPEQAAQFLERALRVVDGVQERLDEHGETLAEEIDAAHRRVRSASADIVRGLKVRPERPSDLLGLYIFMPGGGQ